MSDALTSAAAVAFLVVAAAVIAFEVALAAGAPLGVYAMGGTNPGRLPPRLRVAAAVQAVVIAVLGAIVGSSAGLVAIPLIADLPELIWLVVVFSAISLVLNAISRSPGERRIWAPVALVMLASSLVVAVSTGGGLAG